jgi:serine/threonine protein kinase
MDAHPARHPTDQTLSSYGSGKLDDGSADWVSKHLEGCPACRKRVAELRSDGILGRLRDSQARPVTLAPAMSSTDGLSMLAAGPASVPRPPASSLPPGLADHPDYEIVCELGAGGMGVVYLAQNRLMGRMEVLKVVSSDLTRRRGVLDRFLVEIRNAARLHHPNIVTAYAAHRVAESLVLAMEYVEGLDLAKMVQARGPLPVAHACNYVHQAAVGLQHAHEHGMVHRDIKPGNLMLSRQGQRAVVKLLDFGLAKVRSEGPTEASLTHEGQMLGTPAFIAPEQSLDARKADIRADIYSLGCTLYYLLSGGPPFQGTSLYDILQAHHSQDALPLNLARPEVPVELAALVAKMMAKDPERRFQTPVEVAKALTPFFKPAARLMVRPRSEISRAGQAPLSFEDIESWSAPAQPATPAPAPTFAPKSPPQLQPQGVASDSQAAFEEAKRSTVAMRPRPPVALTSAPVRRAIWFWASIASGVFMFLLVAAWMEGAFQPETPVRPIAIAHPRKNVVAERTRDTLPGATGRSPDGLIRIEEESRRAGAGEPGSPTARTEPRPPGITKSHSAPAIPAPDPSLAVKPPAPPAQSPARRLSTKSGPASVAGGTADGFRPLFNGKNLTGWEVRPPTSGYWRVENGILIGSGA